MNEKVILAGKCFLAAAMLRSSGALASSRDSSDVLDHPEIDNAPLESSLSLYNVHTKQKLHLIYKRNNTYVSGELKRASTFLRDRRNLDTHIIDPKLLDLLYAVKLDLNNRYPTLKVTFNIISGYRSRESNEKLRLAGGGQAKNSMHIYGKAVDVRVPGVSTKELREIAWCQQKGGVGFYPSSRFVHIDTGRVRFWNWVPPGDHCPIKRKLNG